MGTLPPTFKEKYKQLLVSDLSVSDPVQRACDTSLRKGRCHHMAEGVGWFCPSSYVPLCMCVSQSSNPVSLACLGPLLQTRPTLAGELGLEVSHPPLGPAGVLFPQ